MGSPTDNDMIAFRRESQRNKIDVLYNYICIGSGNMDEIAEDVLGDYNEQSGHRVSVITRCYGFEGHNKGRFRSIGATKDDVAAFVRAYPQGAYYDGKGSVMEAFLRDRVASRTNQNASSGQYNASMEERYKQPGKASSTDVMVAQDKVIIIMLIVFLIVTKGFLGWGWIASIVVSIIGAGVFDALVFKRT